jgi:Phage integrase, N-terminal SAM-like domain
VGWFTKRTAEAWLRDLLYQARRGTLSGMVRTGVTFADAAAEWLRFIEEDRARKPSTLSDYRSALKAHLLPAFGSQPLEAITPEQIDAWRPRRWGIRCSSSRLAARRVSGGSLGPVKTSRCRIASRSSSALA